MTNGPAFSLRAKARIHLSGGTVRVRLTLVYGGLFLVCGAVLLAVTYVLFERLTNISKGEGPPIQYPVRRFPDSTLLKGAGASRAAVLHQLLVSSSIALAVLAVVALALGWYVAGRMLRPLRTITATARRISATNLDERLSLPGPKDELKELGDTIDELLGRLQRSWSSQRQFVANVSHELRSPLTRLRLQADLATTDPEATVESLQAGYQTVIATTQQQEELIAALLPLAKGQRGVDQKEPVDLCSIAQDVLRAQRPFAERCGLRITGDISPATISGDPRLINQLVSNLLDNAIVHNTPGGMIDLATTTEAGNGVVSVSNDGPMIPPTELERLFRPFERLEPGRRHHKNGQGLGLSIVDAIADAHGASITSRSRPQGGLSIEVTFPATLPTLSPEGRADRL